MSRAMRSTSNPGSEPTTTRTPAAKLAACPPPERQSNGRHATLPADDAKVLAEASASLARLTEVLGRIAERVEQRAIEETATEAA